MKENSINFKQNNFEEKRNSKSWLRFGVRWIDYAVLFMMIRIFVAAVGGFPKFHEGSGTAFFMKLSFTIPLEAVFIFAFGTTPGKGLGKIQVRNLEGGKTSYCQAL